MIYLSKVNRKSDYMIEKSEISNLKTEIGEKIGQKIIIKGTLGRNKFFEQEATIENAYRE